MKTIKSGSQRVPFSSLPPNKRSKIWKEVDKIYEEKKRKKRWYDRLWNSIRKVLT